MKSISYEEIAEKIKDDKNLNCVAFARTPWHSTGVNASVNMLADRIGKVNAVIAVQPKNEGSDETLLNIDDFKESDKIRLSVFIDEGPIFANLLSGKIIQKYNYYHHYFAKKDCTRTVYVINPHRPARHFLAFASKKLPDIRFINVICDEGLASYMRTPFNWAVEQFATTHSTKRFIRSLLTELPHRVCDKSLKKYGRYIDFGLFTTEKSGKTVKNNAAFPYYQSIIEKEKQNGKNFSKYENAVLFNMQLYHKTGQLKNNADINLIKEICQRLKQNGISVIIKPHPRDTDISRYNDLGVYVENDYSVSQEAILASLTKKPKAVISFTSTSLLTSELFFGVMSISISKLIGNENLSSSLKNEFSHFQKTFGSYVKSPTTKEELFRMLNV